MTDRSSPPSSPAARITPTRGERLPVFLDESGLRWRRVRLTIRIVAVVTSLIAVAVIVAALTLPNLGALRDVLVPTPRAIRQPARIALTKKSRAVAAARRRLFAALSENPAPPALRAAQIRDTPRPRRAALPVVPRRPGSPIVAGFYVNWDDNSLASLDSNRTHLDWAVCEWAFLKKDGTDSMAIDKRVFQIVDADTARHIEPARVLLMLSNANSQLGGGFTGTSAWLRKLVATPESRARVITRLRDSVRVHSMGGVTIDFEAFPPSLDDGIIAFARELGAALHPLGAVVTQTISTDVDPDRAARLAAPNDYVFLMLYDEHYGTSAAGPVASQAWYTQWARDYLRGGIPAQKAIFAMGTYGYHWNDADSNVTAVTYQEALVQARLNGVMPHFDTVAVNPYISWTDPDSTDHVIWFLDGVTGFNQARTAMDMGAAGVAMWRLGAEDPSLWSVLDRNGVTGSVAKLESTHAGYDVEIKGQGEVLRIPQPATRGHRDVRVDPATGLIAFERMTQLAEPYIVQRYGVDSSHRDTNSAYGMTGRKIALTFDDGPDGTWTPQILDTLRAHHVPATFFLIGQNVQAHIALTRRVFAEGHEIGNHTYTHPNLALIPPFLTRLELDVTERLIEAVLDRRSAYFRPPLFGDAEPTTADEYVPISIASDLGFVTAGLHLDSHDWEQPRMTMQMIVDSVLTSHDNHPYDGNVILMHDGGGDRARTVAALGPIIDSLRARGDTLVLLSELTGVSREQAMPKLPLSSLPIRWAEFAAFGSIGLIEWILYWVLTAAVVLGMGRLVFILALAIVQRVRSHRATLRLDAEAAAGHPSPGHGYAPSVSVIVPAYNEEKVIIKTITSLLSQEYGGPLEIVVVDDGSPDDTFDIADEAYGKHPQVAVYTKPNGGKASALNFGIARARGEIVIGLDADTIFLSRTVAELVGPLADAHIGAVAGNAKVGNRVNIVTQWQAVEYVTSQNLDRRAFSLLDCITVVPGAVGAWRKDLVIEAGGFSDDTLAEDQDLTLEIRRRGYSIAYADAAIAYTEAPDTLRGLAKQRFRWSFGTLQCMWKHRDALLRPRYGTLGFIAMPNVWLFQLVLSAIGPLADLMFAYSLFSVWLMKLQHGDTYALVNLQKILVYYAVFLSVDWLTAVIAFVMEPGEDKRLTWLIVIQRFAYRQVMYWVVLRSFTAALRGRVVGWGKLERKATVEVPA